ncbi:MAG: MFS transporter [Candidatus Thermoplasmatota archaeon]|nr:MFS transporter [Candidatus Thermoplasmatota archaeon]
MIGKKKDHMPREFWAVNASNLFERGAYYGVLAVLSYHLVYNIGIDSWTVGVLLAIMMMMINFLPLISTALASKFGFKKLLLFSYVTLCIGYIVLGLGHTIAIIILAVIVIGLGSGFEKALIAASISHSTDRKNRDYAFNIYYWVINIGAFFIPFSLTFLFIPARYGGVFFLMAIFIFCSFLIIILFYSNPVKPDPSIPALKAVKNLKIIFEDPKFYLILIIFSGCWFMLFMRQPFMPLFMTDFGIMPAWFTVTLLAAINPGTIITIGQIWAHFIKDKKVDSFKLLVIGVSIVSLGFLIAGFSMNPYLLVLGIVVLSLGELIAYPSFLSYVSKIPPKEKVSIYMGYSFLPLAIASTFAPITGGVMYYLVAERLSMGRLFWGIIACVGLISVSCLLHYNSYFNRKEVSGPPPQRRADRIKGSRIFSGLYSKLPLALVPVVLIVGISLGTDTLYRKDLSGGEAGDDLVHQESIFQFSGQLYEGEIFQHDISMPEGALIDQIYVNLSWVDEPDMRRSLRRYENEGDTFAARICKDDIVVEEGYGTNPHEQPGEIRIVYKSDKNNSDTDQNFNVEIQLIECGDQYPALGIGAMSIDDVSNSYDLQIVVVYIVTSDVVVINHSIAEINGSSLDPILK